MTINDYLKYQADNAVTEFSNNMIQSLVAIENNNIKKYAKYFNWEITSLEHTNPQKVILIKKEKYEIPELWVKANYTNYRKAFKLHLFKYFEITKINKIYHVDHAIPRNTFKNKDNIYYIKLFLINGKLNCKYGALYEKILSQHNNKKNKFGDFHTNYLTLFKPLGLTLPPYSSSEDERELWAKKCSSYLGKILNEDSEIIFTGIIANLYDGYRNLNLDKNYQTKIGNTRIIRVFSKEDNNYL